MVDGAARTSRWWMWRGASGGLPRAATTCEGEGGDGGEVDGGEGDGGGEVDGGEVDEVDGDELEEAARTAARADELPVGVTSRD